MRVDYSKLWFLLDAKNISRNEFRIQTGLGSSTYLKLLRNENVSTASLLKICEFLQCSLEEIVEIVNL